MHILEFFLQSCGFIKSHWKHWLLYYLIPKGGEEASRKKPSRLKVLPEVDTESDVYQSEDSKQQELLIYYPVSISSSSESAVNTEVLAEQIDTNAMDTSAKLLDSVVKAESGEMVEQSELVPATIKYAQIVNSDSFDEKTPPSKRVSFA